MEYREYIEKTLDKRIGILGECHVYTADESETARGIVSRYDAVAVEGSSRLHVHSILWLPFMIAYCSAKGRYISNDTALRIAEQQKKEIIYFGDSLPLRDSILLALAGIVSIPFAPLARIYGTFERGTSRASFLAGIDAKDRQMAEKAAGIIRKSNYDSLLIVCGGLHVNGIERLLSREFQLERAG